MSTTLQQLPVGTYAVDRVHSSVGLGVKHLGLATYRTTFAEFDVQYADGALTGTAAVESIQIDNADFKAHVLAEDFLDAAATPTLTFASREIRLGADGAVEVDGDLTIRGVTKPVTAKGELAVGQDPYGNDRVAFELEAVIDRREFGLTFQAPTPSGNDALGWDVTLQAHLELVKA